MESKVGVMASKRSTIVHQPQALQAGFLHLPRKKPKRLPQTDELASKGGDKVSCYSAKDLRIKRVFSPNLDIRTSVPSGEEFTGNERPVNENRTRPDRQSGVGRSSETAAVRNEIFCNSNGIVELGDENRRCDGKSEELVHATPPDAEVLAGGFVVDSSTGCPAKADYRIDSVTRTASVIKPCSKRKLFKAPGSIAYKRLLPFLMNSDHYSLQDDSCSKRENNLEKKANIEFNPCNRVKEPSFVDSDNSVKAAVLASGMTSKTSKQDLSPDNNGDAKKFQNGSVSRNDPTLVKEDCGLNEDNAVCASCLDIRLTENGGPKKHHRENLSSDEQSKTNGMERLDGGNSLMSSNISSEVGILKSRVSEKLYNNSSMDNKREDQFNEELKTPSLDSNIACNQAKDEKVESTRGADQNLGSSIVGENHCNIATEGDKKYGPCVRNKVVCNPLVQLKSKYSRNSVSYRRMLPFLEDLFRDNTKNCPSGNIDCSRLEKELPTMNLQPLSSNTHNSQDKSEGLVSCNMPCHGNLDNLSMAVLNTMNETACETEKVLVPAEVNDHLLSPSKLQLVSDPAMLDECKLITDPHLQGAILLNDQAVSSLYPASSYEPLTVDGPRMVSEQSLIPSEECTSLTDNISDGAKLSEIYSLEPNFSCTEARMLPDSRINIGKGILKRNPRGCRGICNCLNCASFRLHAERAFEFSKNQLQDAEEVASDLMKELSFLRDVLEKCSNGAKEDDAGYHSNKVKEACRKAYEAELVAKDRLLQMNNELDIHSRITCSQRPNVRFCSEVEKRQIIEDGK